MTDMEAKGFIQGKLDCMKKCGVFNKEDIKKKDLCDYCDYCYSQGNFGEQKKAFRFAINALEKQIQKKPMFNGKNWYRCVNGCEIHKKQFEKDWYCPNCGQKLDWSDSD